MTSYLVLLALASSVYFLCRPWLVKSAAIVVSALAAPMIFQATAAVIDGKLDSLWLVGWLVTTVICAFWSLLLALAERALSRRKGEPKGTGNSSIKTKGVRVS
jgi:hypothetical protein